MTNTRKFDRRKTPEGETVQQKLFEPPVDDQNINHDIVVGNNLEDSEIPLVKTEPSGNAPDSSASLGAAEASEGSRLDQPLISGAEIPSRDNAHRKLQVSNGYLIEFDQLARILHFMLEHRSNKKIGRNVLQEQTGLADRQIESLVSMGTAMGLIKPRNQVLTPEGLLIAAHDIFFEKTGSLEWCHFAGAGSYRNLIWFEIFNRLLCEAQPMTQEEWTRWIRTDLAGKYSKGTVNKGIYPEIHSIVDAYMKRNFKKLAILHQLPDGRFYRHPYTGFSPLVLVGMVYDYGTAKNARLLQVSEMATAPGSPGVVFGLTEASFRQRVESLHDRGWLRYETTHNLDQIRLKPGFSAIEFLSAYFEDREPVRNDEL